MSSVALIITTYNWPAALGKVLQSLLYQSRLPNEVIVADDGSTSETRLLIEQYRASIEALGIIYTHSWQEDKGFRLSRSRNLAISKSTSDYIICIDGDIIMDKRFIQDHIAQSEFGCFISGKRARLSQVFSESILSTNNMPSTLSTGIERGREGTLRSKVLSKLSSKKTKSVLRVHGCNISFWREDAIKVNGFNDDFIGWGAEDKEFFIRMINAGLFNNEVKFCAVAYHIYHKESSKSMAALNQAIFDATIKHSLTWCKNGLNELINSTVPELNQTPIDTRSEVYPLQRRPKESTALLNNH